MTTDNRTTYRNYKLPNPQNLLSEDVQRLIEALEAVDLDVQDRYTKSEVDAAIAAVINGAPGALDTLQELSAALADDSNFATTVTNNLALKANLSGADFTGDIRIEKASPALTLESTTEGTWSQGDVFSSIEFQTNDIDGTTATAPYSHAYIRAEHSRSGSGHVNPDAGLVFGVSDGSTAPARDAAYLTSDARLGIGKRPTVALDVEGNIKASQSIDCGTQFLGLAEDSAAAPSFSWTGDTDTGLYRTNANELAVSTGGSASARFTGNDFEVYQDVSAGRVNGIYSSGENGIITSYARNTSTHPTSTDWSAYTQLAGRYTVDDGAVYQHITRDSAGNQTVRSSIKANGKAFFSEFVAAGYTQTSTTGTPVNYFDSGVNSVYAYGRNSATHSDSTGWSAYAAMLGDYRGAANGTTQEDTAMFLGVIRNSANTQIPLHNLGTSGSSWHYGSVYAGRSRNSTTSTPTDYYNAGEPGFFAYSVSSGNVTYIAARNVADTSFVYHADVGSPVIEFTADGNGYFDGVADAGAADYAEFFEWADGNPSDEDRRGYSVVLEGELIRFAEPGDDPNKIIGIVSAAPGFVGDSASLNWHGRHLKDVFNARVTQDIEWLVWNDKGAAQPSQDDDRSLRSAAHRWRVSELDTDEAQAWIPEFAREQNLRVTTQALVENPEYDESQQYIPRSQRCEWDPIGLMGKLVMHKGCPTGPRWLKMKDINDDLELWLVR